MGRPPKPVSATRQYFRDRAKRFRDMGLCACGRKRVRGQTRCEKCIYIQKRYRDNLREEVLAAYGHKCQCPGGCDVQISEFLVIDFISEDGHVHRRTVTNPSTIYLQIKNAGFPKDRYRILCHNCSSASDKYGACPHQIAQVKSRTYRLK